MSAPKQETMLIMMIIFISVMFFLGVYVVACGPSVAIVDSPVNVEGFTELSDESSLSSSSHLCPDLLVKRGNTLVLHNTRSGVVAPPLEFSSIDAYIKHTEEQRTRGATCPVLFLQEETNAQGEDVFRIRPTLDSTQNGLSTNAIVPGIVLANKYSNDTFAYNRNAKASPPPLPPPPEQESKLMFPSIDPHGQNVGKYTEVDAVHDSTAKTALSDNPLDTNWGGVNYSIEQANSDKYINNRVYKIVQPTRVPLPVIQ
jgi:hypothetical protein